LYFFFLNKQINLARNCGQTHKYVPLYLTYTDICMHTHTHTQTHTHTRLIDLLINYYKNLAAVINSQREENIITEHAHQYTNNYQKTGPSCLCDIYSIDIWSTSKQLHLKTLQIIEVNANAIFNFCSMIWGGRG